MVLVNFDKHSKLAQLCILEKKIPRNSHVFIMFFSTKKSCLKMSSQPPTKGKNQHEM
jgi:hypothetical protein